MPLYWATFIAILILSYQVKQTKATSPRRVTEHV